MNLTNLSPDTLAFLCVALAVVVLLTRWQMSNDTPFDLQTLLIDGTTGKASLFKTGQLLCLLVSSWILIHETRAGRLNEYLFSGYMVAWAGANLMSKFLDGKPSTPPKA